MFSLIFFSEQTILRCHERWATFCVLTLPRDFLWQQCHVHVLEHRKDVFWTLIKWICVLVLHIAVFSTQWSLERPWCPVLPLAFLFYMTHRGKQNFAVFCYIHSGVGTVADLGLYREDHPRRKVSLSQIPEKGKMVGHVLGWRCQFKKGRSYNFQAGCEEGFQWKRKQVEIQIVSESFMLIKSFLMEIMAFSKMSMVFFARLVWPADTELRR